jgi:hypothetical protein
LQDKKQARKKEKTNGCEKINFTKRAVDNGDCLRGSILRRRIGRSVELQAD